MKTLPPQRFPTLDSVTRPTMDKPPLACFTPLHLETRPTVGTAAASHYLHLAKQTLRMYACREIGPLRPIRISNRLHWKTDDIRRLLSGGAK